MATSQEEEKVVNLLIMGYPEPENDTFLNLLALHIPDFKRPDTMEELESYLHPEKTEVEEEDRPKVLVGYRYQLKFDNLTLVVTYIVREGTTNEELWEHFPSQDDHIHTMVTLVDCAKLYQTYREVNFFLHHGYCNTLVKRLDQVVFFIRVFPPGIYDVKHQSLLRVSNEKDCCKFVKKYTFRNCGDEEGREIPKEDRDDLNDFVKYLKDVKSKNVDDLKCR